MVAWMYLFKNYDLKDWVSFVKCSECRSGWANMTHPPRMMTRLLSCVLSFR
ncbi:DUF935 domain-containing protein [Paenibacillus melissococcoides]|nr:DUF935 domain-containing protein [Paenibacillus melissococcoides]CAH8713715.1 DUF935 domain-containing protein [Paenibacillus melissococcoides]